MQLLMASLLQSRGSGRDKSTEAAFVLVACKMAPRGECGVNVKLFDFWFLF